MKKILIGLLTIILATMWIFNATAGIIGGLWLFFTGGGGIVLSGFIVSLFMPFLYSIVILPQFLLIALATKTAEKGYRFLFSIVAFLTSLYGYFILALWVTYVFNWILSTKNLHPLALWLWAYSVIISPISYMAAGEGSDAGAGTGIGVLFTQLSFIILSLSLLFDNVGAGYGWIWLFLIAFSIFTSILGFYSIPKKKNTYNEMTPAIQEAQVITENQSLPHRVESQQIKYCIHCGKEIHLKAKFCQHCGKKIDE